MTKTTPTSGSLSSFTVTHTLVASFLCQALLLLLEPSLLFMGMDLSTVLFWRADLALQSFREDMPVHRRLFATHPHFLNPAAG